MKDGRHKYIAVIQKTYIIFTFSVQICKSFNSLVIISDTIAKSVTYNLFDPEDPKKNNHMETYLSRMGGILYSLLSQSVQSSYTSNLCYQRSKSSLSLFLNWPFRAFLFIERKKNSICWRCCFSLDHERTFMANNYNIRLNETFSPLNAILGIFAHVFVLLGDF